MKKLIPLLILSVLVGGTAYAWNDDVICWACCAKFKVKEIRGNTVVEKSPREGYEHPLYECDFHSTDFGHGLALCNESPEAIRSINYKEKS